MAAVKGRLQSTLTILTRSQLFYQDTNSHIVKPCACYIQTRGRRYYQRPLKDRFKPWHIKSQAQTVDESLTPENKSFLEEAAVKHYQSQSPLENEPWPRNDWRPDSMRTGVLGIKIGMVPQWKKDGTKIHCQIIQIVDNHVINYTPPEEFQKSAGFYPLWNSNIGSVVVGAMSCLPFNFSRDYHNLFTKAGVPPKRKLTRFWITPDAAVQPGTPLSVMHFRVGDYIDASAKTRYHGFQGVMKRFGFAGGRASHGVTKSHRRLGSLSSGLKSGTHKGRKMPGEMGATWRTVPGLKIWRINTEYNLLYVSQGVPGPNHGFVRIYDTKLHKHRSTRLENTQDSRDIPMPTFYSDDVDGPLPVEYYDKELYNFDDGSIVYEEEKEG